MKTTSDSNAHVKNKLDENKSLSDAIVELVCSFKVPDRTAISMTRDTKYFVKQKLVRSPEDEHQLQDLKKDGADVSGIFLPVIPSFLPLFLHLNKAPKKKPVYLCFASSSHLENPPLFQN